MKAPRPGKVGPNGKAPKSAPARRETAAARATRASRLLASLLNLHPDAECALVHRNAYELLTATILSAQCTDVRVNMVTPQLFARFPTPAKMAEADIREVEELIRSTGFYRNKAKSLVGAARVIVERHSGMVPDTMDELLELPGVARKTANVVLGTAFGKNEGVVVDTHIFRLSHRLGLSQGKDPVAVERDLMALFPRPEWTRLGHVLIWHGRRLCHARKPRCRDCPVAPDCPAAETSA